MARVGFRHDHFNVSIVDHLALRNVGHLSAVVELVFLNVPLDRLCIERFTVCKVHAFPQGPGDAGFFGIYFPCSSQFGDQGPFSIIREQVLVRQGQVEQVCICTGTRCIAGAGNWAVVAQTQGTSHFGSAGRRRTGRSAAGRAAGCGVRAAARGQTQRKGRKAHRLQEIAAFDLFHGRILLLLWFCFLMQGLPRFLASIVNRTCSCHYQKTGFHFSISDSLHRTSGPSRFVSDLSFTFPTSEM